MQETTLLTLKKFILERYFNHEDFTGKKYRRHREFGLYKPRTHRYCQFRHK